MLLAGLEILGEGYQYATRIYFSSTLMGEIRGDLYIQGSGDPTQSSEIIAQIAHSLVKKYNIHHIFGNIVLDNSRFNNEEFLGKGWMWDDENPIIGAIAVKGYHMEDKKFSYFNMMPLVWGELFCQELRRLGVQIDGNLMIGKVKQGMSIKAIFYSEKLDNILANMMKMSDNQSAEIIFRTLPLVQNPKDTSTIHFATTSLSELLLELFNIQWGKDYILVDGCGLSEYNLLTPVQIVMIISYLYRQLGDELLKYLANTNERCTMKERFPFSLWGKTGSLPAASGLAGILETKEKRQVVFCLMENNFFGENNNPKDFEDAIIEYIYEHF
jgi:D-alanyl-D-alanine carboxypeptidase/D-alanyl-D-alanine-endopeptidase (penicillin-binding protein 4)